MGNLRVDSPFYGLGWLLLISTVRPYRVVSVMSTGFDLSCASTFARR